MKFREGCSSYNIDCFANLFLSYVYCYEMIRLKLIPAQLILENCLHPTTSKRTLRIIQIYVLLQRPKIYKVPGFAFIVASLETMLVNWPGILPLVSVENGLGGTKTHQASIIKTNARLNDFKCAYPKYLIVWVFLNCWFPCF